jgi:hypothetical protein
MTQPRLKESLTAAVGVIPFLMSRASPGQRKLLD